MTAALMFGASIPASAAAAIAYPPAVNKTVLVNSGSSVSTTFDFTITPVELTVGNTSEKTSTDGPLAEIQSIHVSTLAGEHEATESGRITFAGYGDASAFPHPGVYAWKITENASANTNGIGTMQFDPQVYTLIATVVNQKTNAGDTLQFRSFLIVKGETTNTENANKVDEISFLNRYSETTTKNNTDLVITKHVTGDQGNKKKKV